MSWPKKLKSPPEPPRAFKSNVQASIEKTIPAIAIDLFNMAKRKFTAAELLDLFIEPSLRAPLTTAFSVAEGCGVHHELFVSLERWSTDRFTARGQLYFQFTYSGTPDGFFVPFRLGGRPNNPLHRCRTDADADLIDKFNDMVERVVRISYEWGLVLQVFKALNQPGFCATPHQLRYIWPSILPILKRAGQSDLVKELQHESARAGDKARAPAFIQPHLRETYDIVTRSILMLGDETPGDGAGPIQVLLREPHFESVSGFNFPGLA